MKGKSEKYANEDMIVRLVFRVPLRLRVELRKFAIERDKTMNATVIDAITKMIEETANDDKTGDK